MSTFDPTGTGPKDTSGRSQKARREEQLLSDLAKGLDIQHHNTSLMHEFGSAFDAPQTVAPNTSGQGSVGQAPSPARSDHQHGAEVPTFVSPVLLNSWAIYANGWILPRYYKMNGRVWLEGLVKDGSSVTATIMNIDVGFRPALHVMFSTICASGASIYPTRIQILSDGNVAQNMTGQTMGTSWFMLTGNWLAA